MVIHCYYNNSGQSVPIARTIETRASQGQYLDISSLGFPRNTGLTTADSIYGFKDGNDIYTLQYQPGQNGRDGYVFYINNSSITFNTADPLPSSNITLIPSYIKRSASAGDDDDSVQSEPGVRLKYYYNQNGDDTQLVSAVETHYFTFQERSAGTNLSNIGFIPDSTKITWPAHDAINTPDRLVFGYVDASKNNKAYFYDTVPSDGANVYLFKGSDGKIYTSIEQLDVNSFVTLEPLYSEAGYRTSKDYFGMITDSTSTKPLELDMVFIPGSYNNRWPYEFMYIQTADSGLDSGEPTGSSKFENTLTDGLNYATRDMYATELMLTQGFVNSLVYYHQSTANPQGGSIRVENDSKVIVTDEKGIETVYQFNNYPNTATDARLKRTQSALQFATSGTNAALADYSSFPDAVWGYATYLDGVVMANLLTHIYNLNNPENQLSYVYYSNKPYSNVLRNATDSNFIFGYTGWTSGSTYIRYAEGAEDRVDTAVYVDNSATGYRIPSLYEYSYMQRIVLDDRLIVNGPNTPTIEGVSYTHPLVLNKNVSGAKFNFLNVNDSTYFPALLSLDYIGNAPGLALYNSNTGLFSRNTARKGYQSMGFQSTTTGRASSKKNQKDGYNYGDTTTDSSYDLNMRNGAGLWGMVGAAGCWTNSRYINQIPAVGSAWSSSLLRQDLANNGYRRVVKGASDSVNTSLNANNLRKFRAGNYFVYNSNTVLNYIGVRFIRYV